MTKWPLFAQCFTMLQVKTVKIRRARSNGNASQLCVCVCLCVVAIGCERINHLAPLFYTFGQTLAI